MGDKKCCYDIDPQIKCGNSELNIIIYLYMKEALICEKKSWKQRDYFTNSEKKHYLPYIYPNHQSF